MFQLSSTAVRSSNMSSVDSITEVGSIADFSDFDKVLNVDEIKLYDNYKFKDPLAISNNLEIAKYKDQVINLHIFKFMYYIQNLKRKNI